MGFLQWSTKKVAVVVSPSKRRRQHTKGHVIPVPDSESDFDPDYLDFNLVNDDDNDLAEYTGVVGMSYGDVGLEHNST